MKTADGGAEQSEQYVYPHDYAGHYVEQEYVPTTTKYYEPGHEGYEDVIWKRMEGLKAAIAQKRRPRKSGQE